MTFRVIEGGMRSIPEHRRNTLSPLERAQSDIINRVAAAIHSAGTEDMPGYPTWQSFVDGAYENAETNPRMLEQVGEIYHAAREAIAAMAPSGPGLDEAIFAEFHPEPAEARAAVEDWIKAVLA